MLTSKMTGLGDFQRHLQEASAALQQIQGNIATLRIDPNDPDAEEKAVREIEAAVDAKVAPYRDNSLVAALAEKSKPVFAEAIRKRIQDARTQS